MKRRTSFLLMLVAIPAIAAVIICWRNHSLNWHDNPGLEGSTGGEVNQGGRAQPPAGRSKVSDRIPAVAVPVETARHAAAEREWARSHNGPVVFYAKVTDQHGAPVTGVALHGALSVFDEGLFTSDENRVRESKIQVLSDAFGHIELKRDSGAWLRIERIEKDGYLWNDPGLTAFGFGVNTPRSGPTYANPNQRLVLPMWKQGPTEPTIRHTLRVPIGTDRVETAYNLLTGKCPEQGVAPDLIIKTPLASDQTKAARGERFFIFEAPSGGIVETSDIYPYAAPAEGYESAWQWLFRPADRIPGAEEWKRSFYIRSRDGRVYVGMKVVLDFAVPAVLIESITNPNGSRVLEPDTSKQMTDPEEIRQVDGQTRRK